ncbi:hypothetical protein FF38_07386 [Lucilia cuprina]|uniref:Uncharacterized protein n=1 Tax=Lucilia cuprina TaxID=7375 RepID=A0A0L0CDH9_LUCCU|nr:hypothetical protein FF38_07386 [Lucilia cuprina]
MFTHLHYLVKSLLPLNQTLKYAKIPNQMSSRSHSNKTLSTKDFEIVDVNVDKMMSEDDEFASNYNYEPAEMQAITDEKTVMAPVDIDPWSDEELQKGGTVDMEYVEKLKEEIHYPEPPKERSGYYEFEGIKIWLPKKMLTPATYRYRLEEGEEESLADDIRICKFEKFKPSS